MIYRRKTIEMPRGMTLGGFRDRGKLNVAAPGKPPKLRYRPGQFIEVENQLFEIIFAYRLVSEPFEWIFCLEERKSFRSIEPGDKIGEIAEAMGCGAETPRIVYEMFRDSMDAHQYFWDIPANGNRQDFTNKNLIQKGKLVSSGEIR